MRISTTIQQTRLSSERVAVERVIEWSLPNRRTYGVFATSWHSRQLAASRRDAMSLPPCECAAASELADWPSDDFKGSCSHLPKEDLSSSAAQGGGAV